MKNIDKRSAGTMPPRTDGEIHRNGVKAECTHRQGALPQHRLNPDAPTPRSRRRVLITGGAGFIGTNVAARLAAEGNEVIIYDNLSRTGVERNLQFLTNHFGQHVTVEIADVRDAGLLRQIVPTVDTIFHFAAQVAVTTSLENPREDFDVNASGTLNVLEACRRCKRPPRLLFTSTNKVYGALKNVPLTLHQNQYVPADDEMAAHGVGESCPLDFHSPYGCSKGVADQYVLDYVRCFQIPAVVFRMSCIFGPHQCGCEDQGWVAHFVRSVLHGEPITLYGDGCQVRDLLYVDDLVRAMLSAVDAMPKTAGCAFNVGGGPANAVSLLQVIEMITAVHGRSPEISFAEWRQGDQAYYASDTRALQSAVKWRPMFTVREGLERLYHWMSTTSPTRDGAAASV